MPRPRTPFALPVHTRLSSSFPQHLAVAVGACLLALVLGCGDASNAPTEPESAPALASATAGALSFRQITVGAAPGLDGHACGVTTDDRAWCWGASRSGQLGDGEEAPDTCGNPCRTRPVAVAGNLRWKHLSAGDRFTCGVTLDDKAYCWGRNFEGQLGNPSAPAVQPSPVEVSGGRRFRQIRTGLAHACALTPADVAFCWGSNPSGQLGDGTTTARPLPTRVVGNRRWSQLSAMIHSCGVTTGNQAYCWGPNQVGQLGDGTTTQRLVPTAVSGGLNVAQIDAGFFHGCAVTTAGRAYCWGLNSGALGNNSTEASSTPVRVFGTRLYDHVSGGYGYTCAVARSARGFCWGANGPGQLGDGTSTKRLKPTAVSGGLELTQVSSTYGFSCAVSTDRRAWCWGLNGHGQLGDGTTDNSLVPVEVGAPL
jgi:alpha-tubulin suppressor-like RCC1 family protein